MSTPHGLVETPIFMPVGTLGTVKGLDSQDIDLLPAQIILANTYHLYLRPGLEVLQESGGLHRFMGWQRPILTDSGGFQAFSLQHPRSFTTNLTSTVKSHQPLAKLSENGVEFRSHLDGSLHQLSPEKSIAIQQVIGADIIMAFDECMSDGYNPSQATASVERTLRWAKRCIVAWESANRSSSWGSYQALFGIIQGGTSPELRQMCAREIVNLPFDGIAVGGETIGYNMTGTGQVMASIESLLPADKPRYAMGLGRDPQNLVEAVLMGFDMFDCVGPTRLARNGTLYHGQLELTSHQLPRFVSPYKLGRLQIGNSEFGSDNHVISPGCNCYTCQQGYTRSYLHHLFKTKELTYYRLASIHNLAFMLAISRQLRSYVLTADIKL